MNSLPQLATPPPSPSKKRKAATDIAPTSTTMGKLLRKIGVGVALTGVPRTFANTFANAGTDREALDHLVRDYIDFIKRDESIQDIDYKTAVRNMKRFIHVASYIPLEIPLPSDVPLLNDLMEVLFSKRQRY